MEQQKFNDNISEWVKVINQSISILQENQDNLNSALEEDLNSINYLFEKLEEIKQELNAIKLIQIISIKQKLKQTIDNTKGSQSGGNNNGTGNSSTSSG